MRAAPFFKTTAAALLETMLSSENLLNMAFLRFLFVININEQAWRQVSSSVISFQVLNVTQEDKLRE
jgi:hypothetical protein